MEIQGRKVRGLAGMSYYDLAAELEAGGRFVVFQYAISLVLVSFRRTTAIHFVRAGRSAAVRGSGPTLLTLLLGWWGIPWGPIYTIGSVYRNLRGGIDVTDELRPHLGDLLAQLPAPVAAEGEEGAAGETTSQLAGDMLTAWLRAPDSVPEMETVSPSLAAALGSSVPAFTFDAFEHREPRAGWSPRRLDFAERLGGWIGLHLPEGWEPHLLPEGVAGAVIDDAGTTRQSLGHLPLDGWAARMPDWLERSRFEGWSFSRLAAGYDRWILVAAADGEAPRWVWGIFTAPGGNVLILKGDAPDASTLRTQLESFATCHPWGFWSGTGPTA